MKTINHECYVSLEVAKLLKEAGFDWGSREFYHANFLTCQYETYAKPTLDVAQKWLREFYKVHILIDCIGAKSWEITLQYFNGNDIKIEDNEFTYEKAQEAGIKKALEIILEKGE